MIGYSSRRDTDSRAGARAKAPSAELCGGSRNHSESRDAAPRSIPSDDALQEIAELMKAFADTGRLRILFALASAELCVYDLAALVGGSQSAVSHQLALLRSARLVRSRRHGKTVFYTLDDSHVKSLLELGLEHAAERIGPKLAPVEAAPARPTAAKRARSASGKAKAKPAAIDRSSRGGVS